MSYSKEEITEALEASGLGALVYGGSIVATDGRVVFSYGATDVLVESILPHVQVDVTVAGGVD
jgi:hypothetical protein